jgi:hypothetical protein
MTRDDYVAILASLLSGDPDRVSTANRQLYEAVVDRDVDDGYDQIGPHPSLALVDAEAQLQG